MTGISHFDSGESLEEGGQKAPDFEDVWRALQLAEDVKDVSVGFSAVSKRSFAKVFIDARLKTEPDPDKIVTVVSRSVCIPRFTSNGGRELEVAFKGFLSSCEIDPYGRTREEEPLGSLQTTIVEGDHGVTFTWKQKLQH